MPDRPFHAADRLIAAIQARRAPACVGLDPVLEKLPRAILAPQPPSNAADAAQRIQGFCEAVIESVAPVIPCVKLQSACFERYGHAGVAALQSLVKLAHGLGLEVILDAKRGDIGISAEHYAAAAFGQGGNADQAAADWLTINGYLGDDAIVPFLKPGHGAFVLVRTSNPGGDVVQNLQLAAGGSVAEAVGAMVARIGSSSVGRAGYSALGAVVGATKPQDARRLREIMPQQIFLVPGYGAQGGGIHDVLACFKSDGTGAIVTASRSVIYAFKSDDPQWAVSVADAAARFADEIGRAAGFR